MLRAKIAASLTALLLAPWATGAPLYDSVYNLSNAGNTSLNRGIWTNNRTYSTITGTFAVAGTSAILDGEVFNSNLGGGFTFNVAMNLLCTSSVTKAGSRKVSVDNPDCNLTRDQRTGGPVSGVDANGQTWDFWNWDSRSELTGTGVLEGLTIDIGQSPTNDSKPFRVGIGADWDDALDLGASGWIDVGTSTCVLGERCASASGFEFNRADFNFRLTAVPAPAPLALLALGLGLLGLRRRLRRT